MSTPPTLYCPYREPALAYLHGSIPKPCSGCLRHLRYGRTGSDRQRECDPSTWDVARRLFTGKPPC